MISSADISVRTDGKTVAGFRNCGTVWIRSEVAEKVADLMSRTYRFRGGGDDDQRSIALAAMIFLAIAYRAWPELKCPGGSGLPEHTWHKTPNDDGRFVCMHCGACRDWEAP